MKRLFFFIVCTTSLFFVLDALAEEPKAEKKEDAASTCEIQLKVTNMACGAGCPPRIKKALEGRDGVTIATVSFEKGSATVTAKKTYCEGTQADSLITTLKDAGYEGTVVSRNIK